MSRAHKGFTLIELLLAMSFLSVLLITIALTIIQIGNIYNRGITLKEVNTTGRSLATELQRNISVSSTFEISGANTRFINSTFGGRLCTGQYSYIWNYGSTINRASITRANANMYDPLLSTTRIRFIKVEDSSSLYCTTPNGYIDKTNATEMLTVGDRDLALHSFTISSDAQARDAKTRQALYSISFILGTNDQTTLASNSTTCKPPSNNTGNLNYCAVNQFDIVVRTSNTGVQ